jgi:hypothetical protein
MKRILLIVAMASLVMLISAPCYGATEITLDKVNGLFSGDTVIAGASVRFDFRLTYTPGDGSAITGSTNGFRVWTTNNGLTGNFSAITYDTMAIGWPNMYDGGFFFSPDPVLGDLVDTIGFGGFALFKPGIVDGFSGDVWWIQTTPVTIGDTLCIDSTSYCPSCPWLWSTNGPLGSFLPDWYGPHCFHVEQCCIGIRGNADGDSDDQVNVADLTSLVAFMFRGGPPPPCEEEGDANGGGGIAGVDDVTYLVNYLFRGGPAPPGCP